MGKRRIERRRPKATVAVHDGENASDAAEAVHNGKNASGAEAAEAVHNGKNASGAEAAEGTPELFTTEKRE
jgi:hypothetical protein